MTIIKTICNRCKKEVYESGRTLKINVKAFYNGSPSKSSINGEYDLDLCADCTMRFEAFVRNTERSDNGT